MAMIFMPTGILRSDESPESPQHRRPGPAAGWSGYRNQLTIASGTTASFSAGLRCLSCART